MKREENAVHQKTNGNNSAKPHSNQGDRLMEMKESTQCLESSNDLAGRFGNSPLRKARYHCMAKYLQRETKLVLEPNVETTFPSWTREQFEQTVDDVLYFEDGKVVKNYEDGTIIIKFQERDLKAKTLKGSNDA